MTQATTTTEHPTMLTLHAGALTLTEIAENSPDRVYDGVLLRPGVYTPGMGNTTAKRIRFTAEFIRRAHESMDGKKVNLEHKQDMESEVGFLRNPHVGNDDELRGTIVLQPSRPKYADAIGFIEGRMKAGDVPEVSVEIVNPVFREPRTPEEAAAWDLELVDGEFDGVSLVTKGACSAEAGCGIGLCCGTSNHQIHAPSTEGEHQKGNANEGDSTDMGNEGEAGTGGHGSGCGCGAAGLKATMDELKAQLAAAEKRVEALEGEKQEAVTAREAAENRVAEFEKAELSALRESVQSVAEAAGVKDEDLKAMLGEEPSKTELNVALKALQLSGRRVGMGRHTAGPAAGDTTPDSYKEALVSRNRLGLNKDTRSVLPKTFHRNGFRVQTEDEN